MNLPGKAKTQINKNRNGFITDMVSEKPTNHGKSYVNTNCRTVSML